MSQTDRAYEKLFNNGNGVSTHSLSKWPLLSPNSIWLVTSRLHMTRHVRRVECVETSVMSRAVQQARHSPNAWVRHVERVVSCQDVTWLAKWNLGFTDRYRRPRHEQQLCWCRRVARWWAFSAEFWTSPWVHAGRLATGLRSMSLWSHLQRQRAK